ncbi:MAG TPA: hypothetical protein VGQ83_23990 [Polyangia bacterium]
MRYTTLRVTAAGVVFYDGHVARLAPEGEAALAAFAAFARQAAPGVHAVTVDGAALRAEPRPASRLVDGMPVRACVSPFAARRGRFPKPASPSPYDGVRTPGVLTLLTAADGGEIYEGCVAAVVGWDGARYVCAPADRPAVASVAEAALRATCSFVEEPLRADGVLPLLALNAVKGPCRLATPGRGRFPDAAVARLEALLEEQTRRP